MELVADNSVTVRPLQVGGMGGGTACGEAEHRLAEPQARRHRLALASLGRCFPGLDPAKLDAGHGAPSHHSDVDVDPATTMAGIDEILSGQDLVDRIEGFHEGSEQPIDAVFSPEASPLVGPLIDAARFEEALAAGLTIRINGVHTRLHQVDELCRQVSFAFATLPNANVYISGSTAPGLSAHVDSHDVFMVQLAGSKGWECGRSSRIPEPDTGGDHHVGPIDWSGTLEVGDGLCLPRGTIHRPVPNGSLSVHVSVGARRPAWSDVLAWVGVDPPKPFHADVSAALACGAKPAAEAIVDELPSGLGRQLEPAAVEQVLARYRFGLPAVRSASIGAVRVAMSRPAAVSVRWCAPGGLCAAVGRTPASSSQMMVGAAGHLFEIGSGDVEPMAELLEGREVTSGCWENHAEGERAVALLSRLGLVEPAGFLPQPGGLIPEGH